MNTTPQFEIVTTTERFLALEPEWKALLARSEDRRFSHSFSWMRAGWLSTGQPRGRSLHILVMRIDAVAVLIWPMTLRRQGLWRVAAPLGGEFTEYDPVLVQDGADAAGLIEFAWTYLRRHSGADVVRMPWVRDNMAIGKLMAAQTLQHTTETLPAPYVSFDGFNAWDDYWRARSKNTKQSLSRRVRRFAEQGEVSFSMVEDPAEFRALLDWTLRNKTVRLAAMGLDNDFMRTDEFHAFLSALALERSDDGYLGMQALRLNGQVVAVKIGAIDAACYEGFIAAQDPAFSQYSVGTIILIECLKWCIASGRSYDFRIGAESYKLEWATGDNPATSYHLANTRWGGVMLKLSALAQQARVAKDTLRQKIPSTWRKRLKSWLTLSRARPDAVRPTANSNHDVTA